MTLKEKLFYLLSLSIEYGINPRAFLWKAAMGRHSETYYSYLAELRRRQPFDRNKLTAVQQNFNEIFENARKIWKSRWDKRWHLVIFDIPERERRFRDKMRRKLLQFGFGQLQESIMICPIDRFSLVEKSVFYEEMKPYLIYLRVDHIHGFDRKEIVSKCWDLGFIRKEYEDFIMVYEKRVQQVLSSSESWAHKQRNVATQWLLLMIEDDLAELLKKYPPLPRQFVSEQLPFDKLASHYRTWRKRLRG